MKLGVFSILILVLAGLVLGLSIAGLPAVATVSIIGGIFIFYVTLFHPVFIIAILLCLAPFNILWIGVGITALELIYSVTYILLGVSWLLKKVLSAIFSAEGQEGKTEGLASPIGPPLIAFFCVTGLACIVGILRGHKLQGWASDLNAIMHYGICFIMLDIIRDKKQLHRLFWMLAVSTILGFFRGIHHLIATTPNMDAGIEIIYRGLAKIRSASVFALVMFILCVAMGTILSKGRRKVLLIILAIFFGTMQLMSFARSIWISAVFGLSFLFFVSLGKQKTNFLKLILMTILFLSLYFSIAMSVPTDNPLYRSIAAIERRYQSIFTVREEPSIMTRGSEWAEVMRKALEHPFLGNGLGTEITYFRYDTWLGTQTWNTTRYVHNVYLLIFLNMGLLGLAAFLWFCFSFIKYGLSIYWSLEEGIDKAFVLGIVSSFASLMAVSLAGPFLTSPMLTMWIGFFIGALIVIDRAQGKPGTSNQ